MASGSNETRLAVINVVGLTDRLIGDRTPALQRFAEQGKRGRIRPAFPAVTCAAQANYQTGKTPSEHGIVGNGWYNRDLAEVQFWKQPDRLIQAPKVWEALRETKPGFTCARLFWWYNMYSSADYSITPRPMYPADGRKVFDIYTHPDTVRYDIKKDLGEFPFPAFWGPAAGRQTPQGKPEEVSDWIARSAEWVEERHQPRLSLIYLPHLDYNLQRYGLEEANLKEDLPRIDAVAGRLIDFFQERSVIPVILSEYGIVDVKRPVFLNRVFREKGWLRFREELGLELLDCGASRVFAVSDHQAAHVYINDESLRSAVRSALENTEGVAAVLDNKEKKEWGIDHERAGDLVVVSEQDAWFSYYYWMDESKAPDFARTVDIHRKPGYDPVELFIDPAIPFPKLKIAWKLLKKKLGFRMLMDLIPLDPSLVKGSHGACPEDERDWPVFISGEAAELNPRIDSTDVYRLIKGMYNLR